MTPRRDAASRWPPARPVCWPRSTPPACSSRADVHVAPRLARLGGETGRAVAARRWRWPSAGAAARLGLRRPAHRRPATVFEAADEAVDVPSLPWPGRRPGSRRCRASPLVADGAGRARRAAAAAGRRAALPGAVLAAGAAGPPPSSTSALRRGPHPPSTPTGCPRRWTGCSGDGGGARRGRPAAAGRRGRAAPLGHRARRRPGHRQDAPPSPSCSPLLGDQPGPPPRIALAAPTGKAAARLQEAVPAPQRLEADDGTGSPTSPRRPCTGCSAGCPAAAAGSGTTRDNRLPLRRRRGRRDVDGVADADGAAAGGGPARRPAGAGRRSRPAVVGRGRARCWPTSPAPLGRPEPRLDTASRGVGLPRTWRSTASSRSSDSGAPRRSPRCRACRPATPTRRGAARAAREDVVFVETDCRRPGRRARAARRDVADAGRGAAPARRAAGDVAGGAGRAGPAPAAVRPPARTVRGGALERARSNAGWPRRCRATASDGEWYLGPAPAGHRQRLRH